MPVRRKHGGGSRGSREAGDFIPLPTAADDHQRRNAEAIVQGGAAVLIPQAELTPDKLAQTVTELMRTARSWSRCRRRREEAFA